MSEVERKAGKQVSQHQQNKRKRREERQLAERWRSGEQIGKGKREEVVGKPTREC